MDKDDNGLHKIDALEHKLYDPKQKTDDINLHHVHDRTEASLPTHWGEDTPVISAIEEDRVQSGLSFGTKMLIVALGVLVVALSFTAWRVLSSRNVVSAENIDLTLEGKTYVDGGEVTPFSITVLNRNTVSLENAVLTLSYEKGTGSSDAEQKVYEKRDLGTLDPNALKKEDMTIVLYGAEADTRDISVKLEYKVAGQNGVFNKVATTQVVLKTPPLGIRIDGPESLVQGQEAVYTISIHNNTQADIARSIVMATIPTTFTVVRSEPKTDVRGYGWNIDNVPQGASTTIKLFGSFSGEPGETSTIKALVGSAGESFGQVGVVYSQDAHSVGITPPLLALSTKLETDRGSAETLRYGDKATLHVYYENKSKETLRNVAVKVFVGGDAPIVSGITSQTGYYNSLIRTVTWNTATSPELASLAPGARGELLMYVPVISRGNNAPKLSLTLDGVATVESTDDTSTRITRSFVVQGSAGFTAWTTYQNPSFTNTGPLPPKANTETTYGVHMVVSAQNALSNTKASFILPAYVSFTGTYSSGANVTYDSKTRTVAWNIGALQASQVATADIQVSVRPSQSHVGQTPPVTSGITLEADEADSKAHIRMTAAALTTELTKEQGVKDVSHVVE